MVALGWLSSSKREKAKKASKQRPRRERGGGGGEGPNVFQFLTTCMVQATKTMTMATAHSSMVVCWPTLLPSLRPFFTEGQKLKTTPLLVAVLDSCKALPMAKPVASHNSAVPLLLCSCSRGHPYMTSDDFYPFSAPSSDFLLVPLYS